MFYYFTSLNILDRLSSLVCFFTGSRVSGSDLFDELTRVALVNTLRPSSPPNLTVVIGVSFFKA